VRRYLEATAARPLPPVVVCIGPTTADAAAEAGLTVNAVASQRSALGVVDALRAYVARDRGR